MGFKSLDDVLHEQVMDLLSAEKQLVAALPKVADAAHSPELKQAIKEHLEETKTHVRRLEDVKGILGMSGSATTCKAMQGLVAEGEEVLGKDGDPVAKDAAIIASASASSTTRSPATGRLARSPASSIIPTPRSC